MSYFSVNMISSSECNIHEAFAVIKHYDLLDEIVDGAEISEVDASVFLVPIYKIDIDLEDEGEAIEKAAERAKGLRHRYAPYGVSANVTRHD